MSSVKLPKPEHWRDKSIGLTLALVLFGVFGVLWTVWTVVMVVRDDYLTAFVTFGFAVFALSAVSAVALIRFGRITPRGTIDSTGTVLRMDRIVARLLGITAAAIVPSGVLFVIFVPRGDIDIPLSRGQQVFFPYLMAFAVACAVAGLGAWMVRGGLGYVRLTPRGVEVADIFFTKLGSWAGVNEITDEATDKQARFPIVMIMNDDPPQIINGANVYTPRGRALYWMIRHYWLHPESRSELTDGRALERLRNEQFEVE